jgi:pilus assembly protein CpaB
VDRRFFTVLGVSLAFALAVSVVFYYASSRARRTWGSGDKQALVNVVVASEPLAVGTILRKDDVKVVKIPKGHFPTGGFQKPEQVLGRPVTSKILANEPVVEGRLAERGSGFGLSPMIPIGMRAASVKVDEVVGVAGFVLPGMRVDVLVTLKMGAPGTARTTTVLQNILVLSAGSHLQPEPGGKAVNVPVVTLCVTPEQAEVLTLAGNAGRVQLVLRNAADAGISRTSGRELSEWYGSSKPQGVSPHRDSHQTQLIKAADAPPKPSSAQGPMPVRREGIEIIRGTQRSLEVLGERSSD